MQIARHRRRHAEIAIALDDCLDIHATQARQHLALKFGLPLRFRRARWESEAFAKAGLVRRHLARLGSIVARLDGIGGREFDRDHAVGRLVDRAVPGQFHAQSRLQEVERNRRNLRRQLLVLDRERSDRCQSDGSRRHYLRRRPEQALNDTILDSFPNAGFQEGFGKFLERFFVHLVVALRAHVLHQRRYRRER
ncbi:hypothetical protein [Allosphingosinicella deserti]|uniref:hypothetical protein n=1 Tax=Allosphingosinicella deserti TaxID=2116704 RepID=UPI0018EE1D53|nr:hypothetical protein [Sphingomonas deserti]